MKPEEGDIEEIENLNQDKKLLKRLKKIYIVVIALLLAALLIMNTNAGYHIISLLSGRIVTSNLGEDYTFALKKGGLVIFEKETYEILRQMYLDNQEHEIKACLTGYRNENNYVVEGLYAPLIYRQDVYSVTSQLCNSSTIVSLHSHPPLSCIFSEQDIESYVAFKGVNPEGIIGVMCGEETITFYGYQNKV